MTRKVLIHDTEATPEQQFEEEEAVVAGLGAVQVVIRTLTSAEILTIASVPIELVAGEAGKYIWPISALLVYHYDADVFTDPGNIVFVGPSGVPVGLHCEAFQALIGGSASRLTICKPAAPGTLVGLGDGVALSLWGDLGDVTGGGSGTLDVIVIYRKVAV